MPTREYYLAQAKALFEMASKMSLKADAQRLIARANEYQILAEAMPPKDALESDSPVMPAPPPTTITQPMQQQQGKKEENE